MKLRLKPIRDIFERFVFGHFGIENFPGRLTIRESESCHEILKSFSSSTFLETKHCKSSLPSFAVTVEAA